jgi:hypothetical protein
MVNLIILNRVPFRSCFKGLGEGYQKRYLSEEVSDFFYELSPFARVKT